MDERKNYPDVFYTTFIDMDNVDKNSLVDGVMQMLQHRGKKIQRDFVVNAVQLVLDEHKGQSIPISSFCDEYNKAAERMIDAAMDKLCDMGFAELTVDDKGNMDYRLNKAGIAYIKSDKHD